MGVNHRHDVRSRLVDFAVDEAFEKQRSAASIDGIAVEVELHDVISHDQCWRKRPRHQKMIRVGRMPRADVTKAVEHAELGEDTAANTDIIALYVIDARSRSSRRLLARWR